VRLTTAAERDRLLAACRREAVHLEMRDIYALSNEAERLKAFREKGQRRVGPDTPDRRHWLDLIRGLPVAAGECAGRASSPSR
jgi:uncharacterized protein DUF6879